MMNCYNVHMTISVVAHSEEEATNIIYKAMSETKNKQAQSNVYGCTIDKVTKGEGNYNEYTEDVESQCDWCSDCDRKNCKERKVEFDPVIK